MVCINTQYYAGHAIPYYGEILNPDKIFDIKDNISSWSSWSQKRIETTIELCESVRYWFTQPVAGGMFETASSSGVELNESETQEPVVGVNHKVVLKRLVIACIATCILSSVNYTTVCGAELSKHILEGK